MRSNTTWRALIKQEMQERCESFNDVVSCTLSDDELDTEFYDGFGVSNGKPFTLWTSGAVYFPVVYDGSEWVRSASRNPDGKPTHHIGGE